MSEDRGQRSSEIEQKVSKVTKKQATLRLWDSRRLITSTTGFLAGCSQRLDAIVPVRILQKSDRFYLQNSYATRNLHGCGEVVALGFAAEELALKPKVTTEKAALAEWVRELTAVSLRWVSARLAMGYDQCRSRPPQNGRGRRAPNQESPVEIGRHSRKIELNTKILGLTTAGLNTNILGLTPARNFGMRSQGYFTIIVVFIVRC
jgi:hypothetical protein